MSIFPPIHTVSLETRTGVGANGDTFAAAVNVVGFLEDGRKLVRSSTGEQVVSESTFFTDLAKADIFTPDSKVTVNGRTALVISAKRRDLGPEHADVNHAEVSLT